MVKSEAQPTEGSLAGQDWVRRRIPIQVELMSRMGVSVDATQDAVLKDKQRGAVEDWVELYAKKFASVVDGDIRLQDQLMSDDETIRQSAMEEVIYALKKKDKKN